MLRRLSVYLLAGCASLLACDDGGAGGADVDAGARPDADGDDGFDESEDPISATDAATGEPPPPMMDAAMPRDAGATLDAGKRPDAGKPDAGDRKPTYGDDCEEVFVFDPAGIDDVRSVVLTGDYSRWTYWVPTVPAGAIPMVREVDGRYYARLTLDREVFRYKFVVNGDSAEPLWLPDPANCLDENDNFNGRNSIRYACQMAPECPVEDAGTEEDAGTDEDAGTSLDAGEPTDAGVVDGGDAPDAGDAGEVPDGSVDVDAGSDTDGGVALDAGVVELDAGEPGDGGVVVDVELGDDCIETFEVDPADYPELSPITSVELRGDAPLSYEEAVVTLHEDSDGIFRATARVEKASFKYNVVVNGKDYLRDRGYCPSADDGFGGRGASLRSTCEVPACCESIDIAWDPSASSCVDVESASYVGPLATWQKPGLPMTLGEDGLFHITFRDAPGSYEYKVIVNDAYISAPDDNCADNGEASMVVKACVP